MRNILIVLITFLTNILFSQTWKPLPMYGGGFITDVVLHPTDPSVVVGVCDVGGIFISQNDCQTWTSHTANVPKTDFRNFHARSFAFDPNNPNTQYYVSGDAPYNSMGKIWKTTNNGTSWTATNLPINISGNNSGRFAGTVLLINPLNTNQLYVAGQPTFNYGSSQFNTDAGLATSNDGGATWIKLGSPTLDKAWITKIKFAPNDPSVIYLSAITKTMNGGSSTATGLWRYNTTTTSLTQLTNNEVLDFDIDAVSTQTIITTSSTANWISTNGGDTWAILNTPSGLTYGLFATAHPTQANTWYFGTYSFAQNTIVTTSDGGATWQQVKYSGTHNSNKKVYPSYLNSNYQPSFGNYMACLVIRGGVAYLSDWYGVWRTPDAAQPLANPNAVITENSNWIWTFWAQGIHNMVQVRTSLHPTDENRFYCNVADLHSYESINAGETMLFRRATPMNMTCRIDYHKNDISVGFTSGTQGHGDIGKIYKTTNGGASWSQIAASIFDSGSKNITDLQLTPSVGTVIVGIERNTLPSQVYRSDDGGSTWMAWDEGLTLANIFKTWDKIDRLLKDADGETFYIWRENKLFKRKLTDAAWSLITLPLPNNWLSGVMTHPTIPQKLYIGQYTNVLYQSTDGGATWTATQPIGGSGNVGTFAVSKQGSLVVQSWENSAHTLRLSRDNGATWAALPTDGFLRLIDGLVFLKDHQLIGWTGGNSAFMTTLPQTVLPIEILDFQGVVKEEGNFLSWKIGDMHEAESIVLEKSENGTNFTPLSIVSKNQDFYLDKKPFDLTYYRLKIKDLGGKMIYSKIISLQNTKAPFGGLGVIKIYPNPVSDILTIENLDNANNIEIVNILGQNIMSLSLLNQREINVSALKSGFYFLKINNQIVKFFKE